MADDWDLQAVVRGCKATAITTSAVTGAGPCCGRDEFVSSSSPIEPRLSPKFDGLTDFFQPPFPKSPLSLFGGSKDQSSTPPPQAVLDNGVKQSPRLSASPRSKRRKNQMKRVCQVPAEGLSSDMWSWRKYGQKPIKGSPYPRGYYRCSTLKGCLARRQVERNRSDPGMFIVTYTGDHNHPMPTHRNSLAGLTRQNKPPVADELVTAADPCKPSTPDSSTSLSPAMEKADACGDDEFGVSDMAIGDDFFDGLEDLVGAGDLFPGHLSANLPFPCPATTAGGC